MDHQIVDVGDPGPIRAHVGPQMLESENPNIIHHKGRVLARQKLFKNLVDQEGSTFWDPHNVPMAGATASFKEENQKETVPEFNPIIM